MQKFLVLIHFVLQNVDVFTHFAQTRKRR